MTSFLQRLQQEGTPFTANSASSPSPDLSSAMDTDAALDPSSSNPSNPSLTSSLSSLALAQPPSSLPPLSSASSPSLSTSAPSPLLHLSSTDVIDTGIAGTTIPSAPAGRDDYAKQEEGSGILTFPVIWNDGSPEHCIRLMTLKNIFSAQLPKMPREYIVRLVFDRNHRSMCICKRKADGEIKVVGGICFRPFHSQGFAEIVRHTTHSATCTPPSL